MKRRNKRSNEISKLLVIVLCCMMMLMTACTNLPGAEVQLSAQEEAKLTALLGDLNTDTPEQVRKEIGALLHKAETLLEKREAKDDYEMSDKEYELWEKITGLLNEETIRQFDEDQYEDEVTDDSIDYGKDTMKNLKETLSKSDWKKLNDLRNEYFKATENEDEEYDVDIEEEIRTIVGKYEELDSDAIVLNLLDDKIQQNLGMFTITPDFKAIYQDGSKNGLKSLSLEKQKDLLKNWKAVTDVLPEELFANFKYFKVGGDGEWGTYAYVIPVDDEGKTWCLTVDPADIKDDGLFPYTIVHEMSHYLTLNEKQVEYYGDEWEYYPMTRYSDWNCVAKEDSYLQSYYNVFWKDIINDWATEPENTYFYYRHQSEFVTGYAASECAEDLAECFCAYVFMEEAPTEAIQAKFDFFDSYSELKQLKQDILKKVKENNVYVNPEIEPEEIFEEAA